MKSSRTITLFSESRDIGPRSSSFAVSVLFHCMAAGLLSFGVMYTPRLDTRAIAQRYTVRNIDLETPEQQARRAARAKVKYPVRKSLTHRLKRNLLPANPLHSRLFSVRLRKRKKVLKRSCSPIFLPK